MHARQKMKIYAIHDVHKLMSLCYCYALCKSFDICYLVGHGLAFIISSPL